MSRCLSPLFTLMQIIICYVSALAPFLTTCHEIGINFSFMNPSIRLGSYIRLPWHFQYDFHPSKMTELVHSFLQKGYFILTTVLRKISLLCTQKEP